MARGPKILHLSSFCVILASCFLSLLLKLFNCSYSRYCVCHCSCFCFFAVVCVCSIITIIWYLLLACILYRLTFLFMFCVVVFLVLLLLCMCCFACVYLFVFFYSSDCPPYRFAYAFPLALIGYFLWLSLGIFSGSLWEFTLALMRDFSGCYRAKRDFKAQFL